MSKHSLNIAVKYGETLREFCDQSEAEDYYIYFEIFCECPQNLVKQRITPHFLTKRTPNYYEFTTKE